jgi:bifunctional non-homologous end joining protein LigD
VTRPALTSLERVLWPAVGFTKGDMLAYYEAIAPVLLPHVAGRPLTLGRFPAGVDRPGFATTECRGRPDWVKTVPVTLRSGEVREQCVVDDVSSLLWVANLGSIELHAFPSAAGRLEEPAFVVLDLDPGPGTGLADCCRVALWIRHALSDDGLAGFCKTSGGLGLHVYIPLEPAHSFDQSKRFARTLAARLAAERPDAVTDRRDTSVRAGRVLIDWVPNSARALTVVPYSLRAADTPSVSTPVAWDEVEAAAARGADHGLAFDPGAVLERVAAMGDLFRPVLGSRQRLSCSGRSYQRSVRVLPGRQANEGAP